MRILKPMKSLLLLILSLAINSCDIEDNNIEIKENTNDVEQNLLNKSNTYNNVKSIVLEVGGSNYPMYDVQGYLDNNDDWFKEGALKLVIGDYHLYPNKVNDQLTTMYQNGQRKIALIIWYNHFNPSITTDTYGHVIPSNKYKLTEQHESNFINVLNQVKSIGYNEIILRFAAQGIASPKSWDETWNEVQYQENWNFINNTIKTMESTLGESPQRVYDLGVEMGGITKGQTEKYVKKLWNNFRYVHPELKSFGFSFAHAPGRLDNLIKNLATTGKLPDEYAFDIYQNFATKIENIKQELADNGEEDKTIVIQECPYNTQEVYTEIMQSITVNNLKVRYIMQWPVAYDSDIKHFTMDYPSEFKEYMSPFIYNAGSGCEDKNCIWIVGQNFEPSKAFIGIRHPETYDKISTYKANEINHTTKNGKRKITFRLKSEEERKLFEEKGLRVYVNNPTYKKWGDGRIVKK
ncbi:hypothetical protein [uncultured Aquimarina sp.]|uniref:hypothetical protein n=1 Tax=uncultured Aquimarina sp. TaxID=575652 RepID=UPI00262B7271|nr:hypothetical protein [uncultured Aquimarina sp.]